MPEEFRFAADIPKEEYLAFLATAPVCSFTQRPEWATVKDNWGSDICGVYAGEKLCAGALLLIRRLPLGIKLIYIPRGPVLDFNNRALCEAFADGIKAYAKKIGAILVKADPFIINESYPEQHAADFGCGYQAAIDALCASGFRHMGFLGGVGDYWQPRFNMAIPLFDENGKYDNARFLKAMPRKTRYYMDSFQTSRGVEFSRAAADDDLGEFVRMLGQTEKRQGIALRNIQYFRTLRQAFGDRAVIYYGKIHLDKYTAYLKQLIDKGESAETNERKLAEALELQKEKGDTICLCASLVLLPNASDRLKIAEYLYAGSDLSILPTLCASVGMIYKAVCDAIAEGCDYFNLGGVDGSFEDQLSRFKLKFAPQIFEYIGEFDMTIRPVACFIFRKLLPAAKKLIKRGDKEKENG